ncbi:MAG: ATP-binding protein [Candidatus Sulfotelmatobacter sp.]
MVILEDLDRAFPTEGKRTQERTVSFQTLLNCLDGVGSHDGVIVVATANDPTCLDAAILKRPGRFDRVVQFRNPDATLRRQYYRRLSPILTGEHFEIAITQTEGFSFAQLRETYIMGSQSAFEKGGEITVADIVEAIELHAAGAQDLKTSISARGFREQCRARYRPLSDVAILRHFAILQKCTRNWSTDWSSGDLIGSIPTAIFAALPCHGDSRFKLGTCSLPAAFVQRCSP